MAITKNCKNCDREFKTYPSINSACCSSRCAQDLVKKNTYNKYKCNCNICGVEFLPPRPKEGAKYCSYKCMGDANRKDRIDRNGYWYVSMPSHPLSNKQGHVPEHHLVMELELGHFVDKNGGMVVHHINGNKKDNDISNLMYLTDSEHKSIHAKERNREDGKYK